MFSKTISAVLLGMRSDMITVEADVSGGLPYFEMVGYLSAEVKEAKERVRTAIRNAGFKLEPRRIIVNLSPADVRKSGTIIVLCEGKIRMTSFESSSSTASFDTRSTCLLIKTYALFSEIASSDISTQSHVSPSSSPIRTIAANAR